MTARKSLVVEIMTDIVERLRSAGDRDEGRPYSTMHEAAEEIERLLEKIDNRDRMIAMHEDFADSQRKEIERLRAALDTCRELRTYDVAEIERLRALLVVRRTT
jgi:hypothetical protein